MALDTQDPKRRDLILRMATRLGKVAAGSRLADQAIHDAMQMPGDAPPYTTDQAAAALLVPDGFEVVDPQYMAGAIMASVRRSGLMPDGRHHPQQSNWGTTLPLALAAAALRAQTVAAADEGLVQGIGTSG